MRASLTLADPFPGGLGVRLGGQLFPWMRLATGLSFAGSSSAGLTNFGVSAQILNAGWEVSPFIGGSVAGVFHTGTGTISSFSGNGVNLYPTVGLDWQSPEGFCLQAGYHFSLRSGLPSTLSASIGWGFKP